MAQPMHAVHEYYMTFFLKGKFCDLKDPSERVQRKSSSLVTLLTEPLGCAYYKGNVVLFSVQFKSNGLFAIFGIPQRTLINTIFPVEDILGNSNRLLTEQLEASKNIFEIGMYMDRYL